jgi:hypothetical protein
LFFVSLLAMRAKVLLFFLVAVLYALGNVAALDEQAVNAAKST